MNNCIVILHLFPCHVITRENRKRKKAIVFYFIKMSDSERLPLKGQVKAAAKLKSPFFQPSTKATSAPLSTESGEGVSLVESLHS